MTGSNISGEAHCRWMEWKIQIVNGRLPDSCNKSLMAISVGFSRVNESVVQSWGMERANWRHPQHTAPRRNGVGNFLIIVSRCSNSIRGVYGWCSHFSMESKKIWEEISGGNARTKGS